MASPEPTPRPRRTALAVAAAATLALAALAPGSAMAEVPVMGYLGWSAGLRSSVTLETPGLDLRIGLGGAVGPLGLELETGWTADHPFHQREQRLAARQTTWLNLLLRIPIGRVALCFGGGGGLGWIKEPDATTPPKFPSHGVHEFVQLEILPAQDEGFVALGLRVEPEHLWQDGVVPGVEHAVSVRFVFRVGGMGY